MKVGFLAMLLVGAALQDCYATSSELIDPSESYSAETVKRLTDEHPSGFRAIDIEFTKATKGSFEAPQVPVISYKFCDETVVRFKHSLDQVLREPGRHSSGELAGVFCQNLLPAQSGTAHWIWGIK